MIEEPKIVTRQGVKICLNMAGLNKALEEAKLHDIIVVDFEMRWLIHEKQFRVNVAMAESSAYMSGARIFFRKSDMEVYFRR